MAQTSRVKGLAFYRRREQPVGRQERQGSGKPEKPRPVTGCKGFRRPGATGMKRKPRAAFTTAPTSVDAQKHIALVRKKPATDAVGFTRDA
jgi:hypothetical protein